MRHFVQYHNADAQGPIRPSRRRMGIYTRKPVEALIGDRVWVISGQGRPRTYALLGSFLVAEVNASSDGTNEAWGRAVTSFAKPVPIGAMNWFPALRHATGNFAFGLQRLKNPDVVNGLLATSTAHAELISPPAMHAGGGWFRTPAENAAVEHAAVEAVSRLYKKQGWQVISHEALCLGYDLHCTKGETVRNVEVKGTRGSKCSFILTANEKDFADRNSSFHLCVVVNALNSKYRAIHEFTAAQLATEFSVEPLSFAVRLRTGD